RCRTSFPARRSSDLKLNATALPAETLNQAYWRSVGFMLKGQRLLADSGEVTEILQPPKLTKVPGVRNWVLGVANVRGRLIPIMDLALLLGFSSQGTWRSRRVLIVEQTEGPVGFLVDTVLGIQQFSLNQRGEKPCFNNNLDP